MYLKFTFVLLLFLLTISTSRNAANNNEHSSTTIDWKNAICQQEITSVIGLCEGECADSKS